MRIAIIMAMIAINSLTGMSQNNWQNNPIGSVFARQGGITPDGTYRFTSNGYQVFTIQSADKSFQPASLYYGVDNKDKEKVDAMAPDGKVPTSMNCFVVKAEDRYIMFDTGLPTANGGKTIERLGSLKITPDQIDIIFITHGHFDHIGGLLDEQGNASYKNAILYVPAKELAFIEKTMKDAYSKISSAYEGRLVIFNEGEVLPCNVLPISAPGHTPGHTAYRLGNLIFVGDLLHGASIQLLDPEICANYDADRVQAIATRNTILSYSVANSLTVLGAHVPLNDILF